MPFKTVESFNHDGIAVARRRKSRRRALPIKQIFLFLVAVVAFKIFLYLNMGGAAFGSKLNELSQGTSVEQAAAWVMQLDPLSEWLVTGLKFGAW